MAEGIILGALVYAIGFYMGRVSPETVSGGDLIAKVKKYTTSVTGELVGRPTAVFITPNRVQDILSEKPDATISDVLQP